MARSRIFALAALFSGFVTAAQAHTGTDVAGGFASGFAHPIHGLDHVVAMVAVGLWGAFLGRTAIRVLPVVFPMVMAVGGAIGVSGFHLSGVETGIALSAIVLGAVVAFAVTPLVWVAAVIAGTFAIFHGYAHGVELPSAADPIAYSVGFVIATGLLHLAGIAIGLIVKWAGGKIVVRACGALIAGAGVAFLTGLVNA